MNPGDVDTILQEFPEDQDLARQLINLRQKPGPALQRRVQDIPYRRTGFYAPGQLAWGMAGLVIVVLLFISPPARAMFSRVQQVIGQIHLVVTEAPLAQSGQTAYLEGRAMSVAEAREAVPIAFATPAYLPPGLAVTDEAFVADLDPPMVKMLWRDAEGGVVQLTARAAGPEITPAQTSVGPGSAEVVLVNDQEAVVIRGGWDQQSQSWGYQDQITTLIWQTNGVQYRLLSVSRTVLLDELTAMAESIH